MVGAGWGKKWGGENKPNVHNPQGLKGLWPVHRAGLDFEIRGLFCCGARSQRAASRFFSTSGAVQLGRRLSETRLIAPPGYEPRSPGLGGRLAETCRRSLS